jgi:type VI secretion system protein ImpA
MLLNDKLIAKLSAPCKAGDPCGAAMDYAPEFVALEQLLYIKPEQQYGDVVIPESTVDWRAVRASSEELLLRTKDLRVAGFWSQAMIALYGLEGLSAGLQLTFELLKSYWSDLHPKLEIEGEFDPLLRSNALLVFSDPLGILAYLRRAELLTIKGITVPVSDAEAVFFRTAGSSLKFDKNQLNLMILEAQSEQQSPIHFAAVAYQTAKSLNDFCITQFGVEISPDLNPLLSILSALNSPITIVDAALDEEAGVDGAPNTAQNLLYNSGKNQATITSRTDASRAMGLICEYFEVNEPASPIPLLLRRAQGMVGKSFIEIMKDLSPDSLSRIEIIAGVSAIDQ